MKSGFVAIAGRPNAGKSTLLNGLCNQKVAIVSDKAQTTRSQIRGICTKDNEYQIVFTDTPGIHKPHHLLDSRMYKEANGVMLGTDLIFLVVDASVSYASGDAFVLNMIKDMQVPVFLLLNKTDLLSKQKIMTTLQSWQQRFDFAEYFPISAKDDKDYTSLIETTVKYLPEGQMLYPDNYVTDTSENFRIAETIREKVLKKTEEEVPQSTAVYVETKKVRKGAMYIQAVILVERSGQKGIIIGKQGNKLKEIGTAARVDLEQQFNKKVYLELFVRVEKDWRDKENRLREFGYGNGVDE